MNIENIFGWKINYSAVQLKSYIKKCGNRNRFSLYLYYLKKRGRRRVECEWLFERGRIFEKNIPNNSGMMYLLFNGKRRNLAHCLLLSSFLLGSETL